MLSLSEFRQKPSGPLLVFDVFLAKSFFEEFLFLISHEYVSGYCGERNEGHDAWPNDEQSYEHEEVAEVSWVPDAFVRSPRDEFVVVVHLP